MGNLFAGYILFRILEYFVKQLVYFFINEE